MENPQLPSGPLDDQDFRHIRRRSPITYVAVVLVLAGIAVLVYLMIKSGSGQEEDWAGYDHR